MKINESQLRKIIQESVKTALNESLSDYDGDNYEEYEEIIERLNDSYDEYQNAISELQSWYLKNIEQSDDMYNSYAGKYGGEAKNLLQQSYSRLGNMLKDEDYY
jgi:hypothetical protein